MSNSLLDRGETEYNKSEAYRHGLKLNQTDYALEPSQLLISFLAVNVIS